ncbi:uncharacterized protein CLAFUR5_02248 [Fulvia fulva]|uniref:Uncharacterized protein n=1 Tax=Passalora fulva TaxID=5499 RepID=A0A9Q8L780_PASFU|nr:uncharacterized protein CLAFUR5_02248 [Fulvia fulva]KAK4637864.1 hypothetical protein CLAFUR0_02256 [Fulvia fulva]UJO12127.1 hypothetical protein CLAFUR5_02248 [Fulvia fulva]
MPQIQDRYQQGIDMLAITCDDLNCSRAKASKNIKAAGNATRWARGMQERARAFQSSHQAERVQWLTQDHFRDVTDLARLNLDDPSAVTKQDALPRYQCKTPKAMNEKQEEWIRGVKEEAAFIQMDNALGRGVMKIYEELCDRIEQSTRTQASSTAQQSSKASNQNGSSDGKQTASAHDRRGGRSSGASEVINQSKQGVSGHLSPKDEDEEQGAAFDNNETTMPTTAGVQISTGTSEDHTEATNASGSAQAFDSQDFSEDDDDLPDISTQSPGTTMTAIKQLSKNSVIQTPTALAPELENFGIARDEDRQPSGHKRKSLVVSYGKTKERDKKQKISA